MKKVFLAVLMIFLMAGVAFASPFLVCDPPVENNVDTYTIYKRPVTDPPTTEWTEHESSISAETDGSIKYDLNAFDSGEWELTVDACNDRGCERAENPTFITLPSAVSPPRNIRLTIE